jgi:hypothetical protein
MKTKTDIKALLVITALAVFCVSALALIKAEALEPKLLWEKEFPFEVSGGNIQMASKSGDVLIFSRDERQIILYDINGNEVFHWGPRVDRQPRDIDISSDGSILLYSTSWTEEYKEEKKVEDWDRRIHYSTRNGKELWNKQILGEAYLSPTGEIIAIAPSAGEGENLTSLNSEGNIMWIYKARGVIYPAFSPDGNYLLFRAEGGLHLLDKDGNFLWKNSNIDDVQSVSEGAAYIATTGDNVIPRRNNEVVIDKHGNIIFEGEGEVSGDGKRLLITYSNKIELLNLPNKTIIKEYPFDHGGFLSYDGRFIATTNLEGDLITIDTTNQESKKVTVDGEYWVLGNTADGKYRSIVVDNKKILFYQVY